MAHKEARTVRINNLIPLLSGSATDIKHVEGRPDKVLNAVRESCEDKARSMAEWKDGIESHCPIPLGHPYKALADPLLSGDPLRTLGCWAYGAGNSWIMIEQITWEDGSVNRPQDEHRKWAQAQWAAMVERARRR